MRTAVVTGASSGLGKAAAKALAAQGWRVIGLGRDPERCAAAEAEIRAASPTGDVAMIRADLSLMSEAVHAAREIAALADHVDVLINNAGGMAAERVMTAEGFEQSFAANHLGPFLLTNRLLPLLRRAAAEAPKGAVRIINVSSDASEMIDDIPWDDLESFATFDPGVAYRASKLANVLHARALAKRLAGVGVIAHAMHPGTVDSNFVSHVAERARAYMATLESIPADKAAETLVWLATDDECGRSSGGYFYMHAPRAPNPKADDHAAIDRLWTESEKLIAQAGY